MSWKESFKQEAAMKTDWQPGNLNRFSSVQQSWSPQVCQLICPSARSQNNPTFHKRHSTWIPLQPFEVNRTEQSQSTKTISVNFQSKTLSDKEQNKNNCQPEAYRTLKTYPPSLQTIATTYSPLKDPISSSQVSIFIHSLDYNQQHWVRFRGLQMSDPCPISL